MLTDIMWNVYYYFISYFIIIIFINVYPDVYMLYDIWMELSLEIREKLSKIRNRNV